MTLYDSKQKTSVINYKKLLQYIIKKGNKQSLENIFRKGLIFWSQSVAYKNFDLTLTNAFKKTLPAVGLRSRRKGSKNIYVPFKISENRKKYLGAHWMLMNAFSKNTRYLYEGIVEELVDCSLNKSESLKKKRSWNKLAADSIGNLRFGPRMKKRKFRKRKTPPPRLYKTALKLMECGIPKRRIAFKKRLKLQV